MVEASYINCAKRATDAKPRTEVACQLCRGAKEEDRRSKGDLEGMSIYQAMKESGMANKKHDPKESRFG